MRRNVPPSKLSYRLSIQEKETALYGYPMLQWEQQKFSKGTITMPVMKTCPSSETSEIMPSLTGSLVEV
jgi:hypothetical protein